MRLTIPRTAFRGWLDRVAVILLLAAVWELFGRSAAGQQANIPPLSDSLRQLLALATDPSFRSALGATLTNTGLGLLITVLIGVPVGLFIGLNRKASLSTGALIDFCRFLPAVAFLPLALLLFGATRDMVISIVVISAVWPMLIQSIYATEQIDSVLRQVSAAFRLTRLDVLRYIYLPSAIPFLFTGLRVSASIALLLSISAEFLGGAPGLGKALNEALINNKTETVFALVLISGGLGLALNGVMQLARRRLLWWHPSERTEK